ncbi:MAG: hypothetical protein ISR72_10945 [Methylobacter sp.]|nr:hypothetical protein [Methylobacter sp.]
MKRNMIFKNLSQDKLLGRKRCIAFHEAGHATAIFLNNKARNLPPVSFQILFKDLNGESEKDIMVYQVAQNDCIARVKGGRSIESLPYSAEVLAQKAVERNNDHAVAFEVDIINLLIGPLAEAKHIAYIDDELFNHQLVNLNALENYGGSSDLKLVDEYLQRLSTCKQQQRKKLDELFTVAFDFINDRANWAAISKLAHYILDSNKSIISCEEVAMLFEH